MYIERIVYLSIKLFIFQSIYLFIYLSVCLFISLSFYLLYLPTNQPQELWNNRAALTKERDREKLSLSFMYNPPAGLKDQDKSEEKQDNFKFEWQRW